jgi:ABC-type transporter Mla subunit MlaD
VVTVSVTQDGFGPFRTDAFCQSRPQSLIGEYFIECEPGHNGKVLKPGSTIPVSRTQSTIPADLLQDVMRLPYRQRFSIIINELGAAAAARSGDLQAALRRAVPALTQTDNLLNVLANDSHTLQQLTVNSDQVITALANNSAGVERFIEEANRAASATATQQDNLKLSLQRFPGLLEQLQPAMKKLGEAATTNQPVFANLQGASAQLNRFFTDLPAFAHVSLPALKSLGKASVTGKQAATAAGPTISDLNKFSQPTPELAQNLSIVLKDLDSRSRAVEPDSRSPGGKGYTGLEALLQYVFNQTLAINGYTQFGHILAVDAFVDLSCTKFATPASIAAGLKQDPNYRRCYSWLGPNQPGVNETDPSDPTACVPDPGGAPPGEPGPKTTACKLSASDTSSHAASDTSGQAKSGASGRARSRAGQPGTGGANSGASSGSPLDISQTIGQIVGAIGGAGASGSGGSGGGSSAAASGDSGSGAGGSSNQAQQLLNYLLAP